MWRLLLTIYNATLDLSIIFAAVPENGREITAVCKKDDSRVIFAQLEIYNCLQCDKPLIAHGFPTALKGLYHCETFNEWHFVFFGTHDHYLY